MLFIWDIVFKSVRVRGIAKVIRASNFCTFEGLAGERHNNIKSQDAFYTRLQRWVQFPIIIRAKYTEGGIGILNSKMRSALRPRKASLG